MPEQSAQALHQRGKVPFCCGTGLGGEPNVYRAGALELYQLPGGERRAPERNVEGRIAEVVFRVSPGGDRSR